MSDFSGMGGALVVCMISQSIVFLALAVMAGVIRLVGVAAGEKPSATPTVPAPVSIGTDDLTSPIGDEDEVAAVIMAALSTELHAKGQTDLAGALKPNAWRLVSLQEDSKAGGRI